VRKSRTVHLGEDACAGSQSPGNAVKPHSVIVIYRGFVYDHHADWRNLKNDRARAAYDNFQPLNGDEVKFFAQ
jgi:alpha-glucuronidase